MKKYKKITVFTKSGGKVSSSNCACDSIELKFTLINDFETIVVPSNNIDYIVYSTGGAQ